MIGSIEVNGLAHLKSYTCIFQPVMNKLKSKSMLGSIIYRLDPFDKGSNSFANF